MATGVMKELAKRAVSGSGMLNMFLGATSVVGDYKDNRAEGRGVIRSAISAGTKAAMWDVVGMGGMMALGAVKRAPMMLSQGLMSAASQARSMDMASRMTPFANSTFADSQQAYTMRQAGMQLAQNSRYNLEQALMGNEASVMHRM